MRTLFLCLLSVVALGALAQPARHIRINEVYQKGEEVWIELYNISDSAVVLEHLYLSDNDEMYRKWPITGHATIQPGEYVLVKNGTGTSGLYADIGKIEGERIYLHQYVAGNLYFLDVVFTGHDEKISLAKYPDGSEREYHSHRATPGRQNDIREFLIFRTTPVVGAGASSAAFRQTANEYTSRPGLFTTMGVMTDFYVMERYKMMLGVTFSRFRYGFSSDDIQSINDKVEAHSVVSDGRNDSRWVDFTFPLIYNSIRVHKKWYVDAGFLVSVQRSEDLQYHLRKTYYNKATGERIGEPVDFHYQGGEEGNDGAVRMPLKLGVTYAVNEHLECSLNYVRRNDPDNPGMGSSKRNLKYAVYVGVNYNINILRIKSL